MLPFQLPAFFPMLMGPVCTVVCVICHMIVVPRWPRLLCCIECRASVFQVIDTMLQCCSSLAVVATIYYSLFQYPNLQVI